MSSLLTTPTSSMASPDQTGDRSTPLSLSLSVFFQASLSATRFISSTIKYLLPISILLYALAPVIVFAQLLFDIFLVWPYKILGSIFDTVYPLYVFVGVSCLVGAAVGGIGRLVALGTIAASHVSDDSAVQAVRIKKEREEVEIGSVMAS